MDIYDGENQLATVTAEHFRKDLLKHKIGTGKHGFIYKTPPFLNDGKDHLIRALFTGTNKELKGSPRKLSGKDKRPKS